MAVYFFKIRVLKILSRGFSAASVDRCVGIMYRGFVSWITRPTSSQDSGFSSPFVQLTEHIMALRDR